MRSVCLSHNALGSTGFELLLKTLPMHCLTHLQLSAVCRGPSDQPAMEILTKLDTSTYFPLVQFRLVKREQNNYPSVFLKCQFMTELFV